jgi:hypothetical protein
MPESNDVAARGEYHEQAKLTFSHATVIKDDEVPAIFRSRRHY